MNDNGTDNLAIFPGVTSLSFDPRVMLEKAKAGRLEKVVILGTDEDGKFFFSSSVSASAEVLWHLIKAQHELMRMEEKLESGEIVV